MSKTYTLSATRYTGFKNHDYSWGTYWGSVEYTNRYTSRVCRCNDYGQDYFFTILMFNNSTLATLRTKTVTSITLAMTFSDTDANGDIAVRFKYNSSTSEFSTANQAQTGYGTYNVLTSTANSSSKSWNITSSGVPVYGFVVGPDGTTNLSNWITISSATLTIVTNENDYSYTLAYNANGGSGAPSNQTGSNSQGSPSYTFTISSTVPTRSGYNFQGWSTSSSATTASYYPGGTITVTSAGTTTLYAVWAQSNVDRTYTFSLTPQGVKTSWGYLSNFNFNQQHGAALVGYDSNYDRTQYQNFGTMLVGDIAVSGTIQSISLTVQFSYNEYQKGVRIAKKTGAGASHYGYSSLGYEPVLGATHGATSFTIDLTSAGLCPYGYLLYQPDYNTYVANPATVQSATLTIVVSQNASQATLIYSANGGIGGPGVVTATTSNSSYTFNISYSVPTKTGFECLGWATTANSSTVSYTGGDTITVSISTPIVLYAVWRPINTVRMVNRIGTKLKTYKIYIIDNNNTLVPHYAMIVSEGGVGLENYF